MLSKTAISGAFYVVAMYLVKTNYIIPAIISFAGATLIHKVKFKNHSAEGTAWQSPAGRKVSHSTNVPTTRA